jgi:hypothetical protein
MSVQTEFGARPHPLEYFWLRLHGAAAMLGLLALGSLVPMHVQRAWQQRKNRVSGLVTSAASLVLLVSGYLLYYFATENSRPWIGALHWGVGLAGLPVLIWHVLAGLRLRQRGHREPSRPLSSRSQTELAPPDARLH